MIPTYIKDWLNIIENMNNDNTYKLAWGRAILECINDNSYTESSDICIISFDDISKCMIKYYWNQMFFFGLKQSPYDTDPVICKDTNKLIEVYKRLSKSSIPVWFDRGLDIINKDSNDFYNKIVCHVTKTLHMDVCWRFKRVNSEDIDIYEYNKGISNIRFKKEEIEYLKEYNIILAKLLNYKWTQLLEKFNFAPKIASKVNGISLAKLRRNSLAKYKEQLLLEFLGKPIIDFYTGEELAIDNISIDHVIPWSYMYSDDIWNLVITSKSFNSTKSNSIPSEETITKLKERNEKLLSLLLDGKYISDMREAINNNYVDKFYNECRL